jgi:glycosyltransferase involved in cell wall biosynthesis
MNILHIEDEPWDSGIAYYALTLASEQARRGHNVEFWGQDGSPVMEAARERGLVARGWGSVSWLAQRRQAAEFSPHVINAHTGAAHSLALALSAGRPCAVVRTRGDSRAARSNALTRFVASRTATYIAANSELEASLKAAFPVAKVRRVPQGLDGPPETPALTKAPVVGMLARFDPVKGHETLLDAAVALKGKIPDLRVRCAGEGSLLERLRWQLKPIGLDAVVDFPGYVTHRWPFMAACRVGVVPSLGSEAVSRAALEWMASGRPVVASRVGGLPDIVEDGVTGLLVPPDDSAALAEALSKLLLAPAKAEEMGRAARRRWEQSYSLQPFYEATQRVYDEATRDLPS